MLTIVLIMLAAAAVIVLLLIVVLFVFLSYQYRLDEQTAQLERLPASFDGTNFVFISDIHRRVIPEHLIEKCIAAGGADLVLIGGDLRERNVPMARIRSNIQKLTRIAPVYLVYGNHDYDDDMRELEVMLAEERVRLLVNESVVLEQRDGSRIRLTGVDDPRTKRDRLSLALSEPEDGNELCTIVLAHAPILATRLPDDAAIDLILAGHTHGGQIALPFMGPVLRRETDSPWLRGWFQFARKQTTGPRLTRLFVSCGFGTSGLPIRFMTPPELHRITLRRSGQ
ncbi:putative MPP superfamily phosphohydrolase [Paenibacillus taihuensis]|uniref:Putative MPP superfamily phosphohydrolase n=1 Tax=Paenibacillus taihuensis TaxID=1156355 RepID=A0A3D9SNU8_9BACL|nr:metallophosphoesterase [Paenibacillus taihuensis]REE94244.1 putative MPP superfamily phosphohydrolase [Paenibacillus taihuensis]